MDDVGLGEVWEVNGEKVLIIQKPGKLVLYMTANHKYGSLYTESFLEVAKPIKTFDQVLD